MELEVTQQQKEIITSSTGKFLVLAGAGSGKTFTLIKRCAYLIKTKKAKPNQIVLLSFTNKSANEMKERVNKLLGKNTNIYASTIHSFCCFILFKFCSLVSLEPNFSILDEEDSLHIFKNIIKEYEFNFPDFAKKPEMLFSIKSRMDNMLISLKEAIDYYLFDYSEEDKKEVENKLKRLIDIYEQYKIENNCIDFDGILLKTYKVLKNNDEVISFLNKRFKFLMVDEAQDINKLQLEIIKEMSKAIPNIMLVGDDSQSIYGFRGVDVRKIKDFQKEMNVKILKMEKNFRSFKPILDFANVVIEKSPYCFKKDLIPSKNEKEIKKPVFAFLLDKNTEAEFVVNKIKNLLEDKNNRQKIAVLFRSGYHSSVLEVYLIENNISYIKYGGLSFFAKAVVKDFLSYLRILSNPKDKVAWNRVLMKYKGIGLKKASEITSFVIEKRSFKSILEYKSNKKVEESLKTFYDLIKKCIVLKRKSMLEKLVEIVYNHYCKMFIDNNSKLSDKEKDKKRKDIEVFIDLAKNKKFKNNLNVFVKMLALSDSLSSKNNDKDYDVVLSTVHSAKGLEWDYVFVIHCVNGKFPSAKSFRSDYELDEERRLFFVAVTRAKKELVLTSFVDSNDLEISFSYPSDIRKRFLINSCHKVLPSFLKEIENLDDYTDIEYHF